jgi:hypothetical protein
MERRRKLFLFLIVNLTLSLKVIILPNFMIKHFPGYSLFIGMILFSTSITLLMISFMTGHLAF